MARLDLEVAREQLSVDLAQIQEGRVTMRQVEEARVLESQKWIAFYDAQYALEKARWNVLRLTGDLVASLEARPDSASKQLHVVSQIVWRSSLRRFVRRRFRLGGRHPCRHALVYLVYCPRISWTGMRCFGGADPRSWGPQPAPRPASRSKASLSRHLEKGRRGRRPRTRGSAPNKR